MALRVTRQYNEVLAEGEGAIRVTRQYAEVLATGDGNVRVTRQYIEVLSEISTDIIESVNNVMALTQNVVSSGVYTRNISHTLNLSDEALASQTWQESVSNTMNLASIASVVEAHSVSNTMSLTQQIIKIHIPADFYPLSSTINFTQQADWEVGLYQHVTSSIVFVHQVAEQAPYYFYINTYLSNISGAASAVRGCPWLPVEFTDELSLTSVLNRTYEYSVNNVITMTQGTYRKQTPESILNLGQSLTWGKTKGIPATELDLVHTLNLNADWTRAFEHSNIIGHALTYYIDSPCGVKQYIPFVGENTISSAPAPPSTSEPIVQNDPTTERFKLKYPALATPTDEVELRAPELDNIDRIAFNRISRETRGGKLTVFADPNWPQVQTVIVTFIGLTRTEIDDLLTFFTSYVGEEISMQDWEGREWIGVITTPNEAAVQDGKSCTGRGWTITFEFEGVLVESNIPNNQLNLMDTLGLEMEYVRELTHDLSLIHSAAYIKVTP